jgi:RNA-directed DNA polymerase
MERLTRQQIYDRIRETSKEEYILAEMKRLGFWKAADGIPKLSETLITQKGELRRELNTLVEKQRKYQDKERLLQEMRKKRMKEALERREETKKRRQAEREARAARWEAIKASEIIYLGEGVSAGLAHKETNKEQLAQNQLPYFESVEELAKAMDISMGELRFLSFSRKTSKVNHYKQFYLPKKSGGKRLISAPMPRLKNLQYWILNNILYKKEVHEAAQGFVPERSIITNAQKHTGKAVVINMDMKDFFPSISYKRVKGLFKALGYSEQISTILALVCTEAEVDPVILDGERYFVAKGERKLPQGAPTSPAITNLICHRLDRRFEGMAKKMGWTYSRYADDISLSSDSTADINRILWQAKLIIEDEGFELHPSKLKVMRKGSQQEVTGLVVNERPNVSRKTLKNFRSVLHKIEQNGIKGLSWGNGFILLTIQGYANYIKMVNPEKGEKFVQQVANILAKAENKAALANYWKTKAQEKTQKETADHTKEEELKTTTLDSEISRTQTKEESQEWWRLW